MNIRLRLARKSDFVAYTALLQRTHEATFPNKKIGLTKKCFSKEIFATDDTQAYLRSNLEKGAHQRTWLAVTGRELVGAITIEKKGKEYEIRGFYVASEHQGHGIGKRSWQRALGFADGRPVVLDVYAHTRNIIALYKRWGFVVDKKKKPTYSHWPEWPKGMRVKRIYMRRENA